MAATETMAYDLQGSLLEVCSCNVLCPCWIGVDPDGGDCQSVVAYHFDRGLIRGVDVSGLTTSMELTANRRPFLYFPLRHHFEQNFHVRHRLERYGAGRCMDFDDAEPDLIAEAIAAEIGREVGYRDVESDGAARAARRISELL